MKLVIVESPNKCKTIKHYLGTGYQVMASKGHVRDLAKVGKDRLGVDCEHSFKPIYTIIKDKQEIVNELKAEVKKADEVILATDPDREGEAIAWHLSEILHLDKDNKRLEFHEITRESIEEAIKHPRKIDRKLVSSQEARRIIDRIIGFRMSDVLQRKNNLSSGGRVQSATLRMIVEHEREIEKFKPETFYTLSAKLIKGSTKVEAPLFKYKDKDVFINKKELLNEIIKATGKEVTIKEVNKKVITINPKLPYTTSTLQQDAITKLGLTAKQVSSLAQQLYEGLKINGEHVGLITYIRTDSTRISDTFINSAKRFIKSEYGEEYLAGDKDSESKAIPLAQNAHEAIRPTSAKRTPSEVRKYLHHKQARLCQLYELIYNRTMAFLMTSKKEESTAVLFGNDKVTYKVQGSKIIYPGYEVLTGKSEEKHLGFEPKEGDIYKVDDLLTKEDQTKPPARYSEARVIHLMEEKGIGRPSTYSTTISTLQKHNYIIVERSAITPTEGGKQAVEFLEKKFASIVDYDFTKDMEDQLDKVEDGEAGRTTVINKIYIPFMEYYDEAIKGVLGKCPKCGKRLERKRSRYGWFIGCSNYPKCNYIKPNEKPKPILLDKKCPKCGAPLVKRISKTGKTFIGCSAFPKCHYIEGKLEQPKKLQVVKKCPECLTGDMIIRNGWDRVKKRKAKFLGCTNYPTCRHTEPFIPEKEKVVATIDKTLPEKELKAELKELDKKLAADPKTAAPKIPLSQQEEAKKDNNETKVEKKSTSK